MVRTYRVCKGDTLGRIARGQYGDAACFPLIVAANHIANPDRLKVGQELIIPDLATATAGTGPPPSPPAAPGLFDPYTALNLRRLRGLHQAHLFLTPMQLRTSTRFSLSSILTTSTHTQERWMGHSFMTARTPILNYRLISWAQKLR